MNTHDHHDNEPLPGENELKALYRSLPRKEPAPALDQAVRRAAADAVRPGRRMPRWPVAAASAAVLVLAAGVSWRLHEQPSSLPPAPAPGAAAILTSPPAAALSAPTANSANQAAGTLAEQTAAPAAAPESRAKNNPQQARESIRSALKPRVIAPASIAQQAAAPAAASAPMVMAAQEAAPAPSLQPVPAPEPQAGYGNRDAIAAKAMAAPMRAESPVRDSTAVNAADTPTQELDKIRQLFAQQRRDEALQRLTAFQRAHPDVSLPDDLRNQLPDHE